MEAFRIAKRKLPTSNCRDEEGLEKRHTDDDLLLFTAAALAQMLGQRSAQSRDDGASGSDSRQQETLKREEQI